MHRWARTSDPKPSIWVSAAAARASCCSSAACALHHATAHAATFSIARRRSGAPGWWAVLIRSSRGSELEATAAPTAPLSRNAPKHRARKHQGAPITVDVQYVHPTAPYAIQGLFMR
jgi:hypothetical protein